MLIIPQDDEQLCPVCSAGGAGSGGRAAPHPLFTAYVSFDYPKPSSAETWEWWSLFPKPSEKKQKEKKLLPNYSVSLLKVTNVLVSSVLLWKASLYIWYVVSTKNYWHLEHYQGKINPSFFRGIYIKMKLFHPPIVSNTVIYSFYSLGFLSLFKRMVQYNTLDLNELFIDKNKEAGRTVL